MASRDLKILALSPTPTHPLDAGNRKRIYHADRAFQQFGAEITFLHYPAEADWRTGIPEVALAEMQKQWHFHFTVPVTRALHEGAKGPDHLADEWWDPAIGDMLQWLFSIKQFDIFVVHYTWLSKAFDYCPKATLKVLDTNDRFSGRREILARSGIPPEFFHLDETQEKVALDRADVVWSIKPEEGAFFRSITKKKVVNLPFFEPFRAVAPARAAADWAPGILKIGIVGAANNINKEHIEKFLAECLSYVEKTLTPFYVLVAGSICDILKNYQMPWIIKLGKFENIEDFYANIDVCVIPIENSTGLKIKTGEAMCLGKPVIALRHAFEGYRPHHGFHKLNQISEIFAAIRQIIDNPALLDDLAIASMRSVMASQVEFTNGIRQTVDLAFGLLPGICILVHIQDVFTASPVLDHAIDAANYMKNLARVNFYVFGRGDTAALAQTLERMATHGAISISPELWNDLNVAPERRNNATRIKVLEFQDLLDSDPICLWFASAPEELSRRRRPIAIRTYLSFEGFIQSHRPEEFCQCADEMAASYSDLVPVSVRSSAEFFSAIRPDRFRLVPYLWRGETSVAVHTLQQMSADIVLVMVDDIADPLTALTVAIIRAICAKRIEIVSSAEAATHPDGADWGGDGNILCLGVRDYFQRRPTRDVGPLLALRIGTSPRFAALAEILHRAGVPIADLFASGSLPSSGRWKEPVGAAGMFESTLLIERLLRNQAERDALLRARGWSTPYAADAGWARIWIDLVELTNGCETSLVSLA